MNMLNDFIKNSAPGRPIAEVLADILRRRIIDGDLLPGARLVEAEIAKLYGVSRGPVREALRMLDSEGLIECEKHRSPTVRGVSVKRFEQMFEIRGVLEGFAASIAAVKIQDSKEALRLAKTRAETWRKNGFSRTPAEHIENNVALHAWILEIADHELLTDQIGLLNMPGYRAVLEPMLTPAQMEKSAQQHAEILDAIIAGNGKRAETLMRSHIDHTRARAAANFSVEFFSPQMNELRRLQGR